MPPARSPERHMRLVTVGTGTVVPHADHASACHWVEEGGTRIVMDCGAGGLQGLARARLPWGRLTDLLISHFHPDHIVEIPGLIFALRHGLESPREEPLRVTGPGGTQSLFEAWSKAYGPWVLDPGFGLEISELAPGSSATIGSMTVRAMSTPHTDESLAFRLEAGSGGLGYTGDTGPSDELARFFQRLDLLLAECSLPDELVGENHLSPARVARLADLAGVPRLAITHVYPQLARRDVEREIRDAGYTGEIVLAADGMEFEIGSGL